MSKKTGKSQNGKSDNHAEHPDKHKKKNTSLRLDKETLKALKIRAIEQDTSIQNLIESLIKEYLKK
jgi:predicted HicB family RNase H-like nuclease